ncbi:hypothetical protein [Nocardioides marmorisolisilvae]|uniref:Uncharacterized protein n=1 Tax=Nocardioides marmorisolisilvae TaxID=1542737 RepID=A0A3N0DI95_9ACTN|nr:hypothetical protein [Nocardioides marmorisolisilvae]RNL75407.1 hypothetical protein EFL95_18510 [Nocardioides marmorisolisilvae]
MTDERFDDADFDDPAHAAVRDLLASAKVETPIPAEVAARLEATLAELTGAAPRGEAPLPVPDEDDPVVVPLRRRSRLAPRILAAAAVVIVAGAGAVGLGQVLDNTSSNKSASADSANTSDAGGSAAVPTVPPPGPVMSPEDSVTEASGKSYDFNAALRSVPVLTTDTFATQVSGIDFAQAARRGAKNLNRLYTLGSTPTTTDQASGDLEDTSGSVPTPQSADANASKSTVLALARAAGQCAGPKIDGTKTYPIVLDNQPAVLVVHPANAGTQLVEAWACDGSKVLAFTTVPA